MRCLIERDGVAVALGLVLGIVSLVLVTARSISLTSLKGYLDRIARLTSNITKTLRTLARKAVTTLLETLFVRLLERHPDVGARRMGHRG